MFYREHPSFKKRVALWDFFMTSYRGGDEYIGAGLLHRHRFESLGDFKKRLVRAYYLNYVRPIVDLYTKYICGAPLSRAVLDQSDKNRFEGFNLNADGKRTPLSSLIARVCTLTSIYGKQGVLVDGSAAIENAPAVPTKEFDARFFPRLRLIKPTQLLDWSVNGVGEFEWIFFKYTVDISQNPNARRSVESRYELWTRENYTVFKDAPVGSGKILATINGSQEQLVIPIKSFDHNLGVVPYCEFFHTDSDEDGVPESMIEDLAIINRSIFNKCSLIDEIEYNQAFSQLTLPADDGEVKETIIGTSRVWTFPKDSPFPPAYISPDASQAKLLREGIRDAITEMYRIAVLRKGGTSETDQYSTAYGKMVDFEDTEAALTAKASIMEACERDLSLFVNKWYRKDAGLWEPSYPKAFEVRSFTQEIQDALSLEGLGMGDTFMAEIRKRIARRALPQAKSEVLAVIDKEIEAIKLTLPDPDPSGVDREPVRGRVK